MSDHRAVAVRFELPDPDLPEDTGTSDTGTPNDTGSTPGDTGPDGPSPTRPDEGGSDDFSSCGCGGGTGSGPFSLALDLANWNIGFVSVRDASIARIGCPEVDVSSPTRSGRSPGDGPPPGPRRASRGVQLRPERADHLEKVLDGLADSMAAYEKMRHAANPFSRSR